MHRNIALYPWLQACANLVFWQAIWFLYFEGVLGPGEAILLAAIYDMAKVALEVPSGYFSDYLGRRVTLIIAMASLAAGSLVLFSGESFYAFALGQVLLAAGVAFTSGTDSALLYESLIAERREHEVAEQEARAWRFRFGALAISAALGGALSLYSLRLAFLATAVAALVALVLSFLLREPPHPEGHARAERPLRQLAAVAGRLRDPVLLWVFVFVVGGYVLSHVPFVFAQPYLKETLAQFDLQAHTPLIMGLVTAAMMFVSLLAGGAALPLSRRAGIHGAFVAALVVEVGLVLAMALIVHPLVIGFLLLRMVPTALSRPFVLLAVQPRLQSGYRATYLSVQSQAGALAFAGTLFLAAWSVAGADAFDRAAMVQVLPYYAAGGVALLIVLALTARRALADIGAKPRDP